MSVLSQQLFSHFPFFESLSPDSLRSIERDSLHKVFQKQANLIFKGDRVSGAYLVEAGGLRIYNIDPRGKETTLYSVLPGESCLLALNCVFSDVLYPAWVNVESSPTSVLVIPSATYKRLHATENVIRDFTFNILSARLFDLMSTLEEITTQEIDQRLASFLVRKANSNGEVLLSHQDIANHLGTAREVVSRILARFRNHGLIETTRGCIKINSIRELASK